MDFIFRHHKMIAVALWGVVLVLAAIPCSAQVTPNDTETPTPSVTETPTSTVTGSLTLSRTQTPTATVTPIQQNPTETVVPSTKIRVYPNPVSGDTISFVYAMKGPGRVQVRVYDLSGDFVDAAEQWGRAGAGILGFSVKGMASNVYLYVLEIQYDSGKISRQSGKFVVLR